ncbi:MAG: VanW family protein [Eubacterium sp.]|nr:VanW family protein [Eubacterium sp.]
MRIRRLFASLLILFMFMVILLYMYISYNSIKPAADRIAEGVRIETIDVGGMTGSEASAAVQSLLLEKKSRAIEVDINGKSVVSNLGEIGYAYSVDKAIGEALKVGKRGGIAENYGEIKKAAAGQISYGFEVEFDKDVLTDFVKTECKKLCTKAKNASIKRKNGQFVYTNSRPGVKMEMESTVELIATKVNEEKSGDGLIKVVVPVEVAEPKYSKKLVKRCKDKIGSFSTEYNPGNVNRSKNLANAAKLINGSVIYPGKVFSVYKTIGPITKKNGYFEAASYNNGKVEETAGGGVCQVSTTLYNAVLRAELEIVSRSPHSMVVSYVQPSMDAAMAGDYKDFKFKNNTDVPLYIEGSVYNGTIYFNIYGEETRPEGRTIRFESKVEQEIEPGADKVTYDNTKYKSYVAVTQEAHKGCKASLWKIVTENGKESKVQVNSSNYAASPRYIVKGTKEAVVATQPPATKAPEIRDDEDDDENVGNTRAKNPSKVSNGAGNANNSNAGAGNVDNNANVDNARSEAAGQGNDQVGE